MSDQQKYDGGVLRQARKNLFLSQEEIANRAGISRRSVIATEKGTAEINTVLKYLDALEYFGLDPVDQTELEHELNPFRSKRPPLSEDDRWEIRRQLRNRMLRVSRSLPAFVIDEYWFLRAVNVYILAVHQIEPKMLHLPEAWHIIALKFHPKLKINQARGDQWRDYYLAAVKEFRRAIDPLQGTNRYRKLIQWHRGLDGFAAFWSKAKRELEYEVEILLDESIPTNIDSEFILFAEVGGNFRVLPQLPPYYRGIWLPEDPTGDRDLTTILHDIRLGEIAEGLGYDVNKQPIAYLEDYISEGQLKEIGGWIE